jgi:LPXTG-motif cell wall-anchored protein
MRLIRWVVPIAALALSTTMIPATAATANPYPPAGPVITASDGAIVVGESVEITGTGFAPGETVNFGIEYQSLGMGGGQPGEARMAPISHTLSRFARDSLVTDREGGFRHDLTLNQVGRATITYMGDRSGLSGSVSVLVVSARDQLPTTGTDGGTYLWIGLGALLVGSCLVALTVRRRRVGTPSEV